MASKKKSNAKVGRADKASKVFETDMPLDVKGVIGIEGVQESTFLSVLTGMVDLSARNEMMAEAPAARPAVADAAPPVAQAAPPVAPDVTPPAAPPEEPASPFKAVSMPSMNVELPPPPGAAPGTDGLPAPLRDNKVPHAHQQVVWTGPLPNIQIEGLTRQGGPGIAHVALTIPKGAHSLSVLGITLHPSIRNNLLLRQVFHGPHGQPYYDTPQDMSLEGWNTSEANIWIPQGLVIRENQPVVLLLINPRPERVMVFGAFTGMMERFVPVGADAPA